MKKLIIILSLLISSAIFANSKLPTDLTDDFIKTVSVELLINNIQENYQVLKLTSVRNVENGIELLGGLTWIKRLDGKCEQVAAVVESDTCQTVDTCKLQAYLLDCPANFSDESFSKKSNLTHL